MVRDPNAYNADLFTPATPPARAAQPRRAGGGLGLDVNNAVKGRLGNTAPLNSKTGKWFATAEASKGSVAFFDWVRFSAIVEHVDYVAMRADLETLREQAGENGEAVLTSVGDQVVAVEGYGIGKGTCYRRYVLRVAGMVVSIPDDPEGRIWVEMSGEPLTNLGFQECMRIVDRVISGLGMTVVSTQVSRVDLAADVLGRTAGEVFAMMHGVNATRIGDASKWQVYFDGEDVQTVSIGAASAEVKCRCYDKLAELRDKPERLAQLQKRWGEAPESVLRVEFEVKRGKLAKLKIDSVPGLLANLDRLLNLLTYEWLRFAPRDQDLDRTNTTRAGVDPLWEETRSVFERFAKGWEQGDPEETHTAPVPAKRMLAQAAGCIKRYLALVGTVPEHPEGAILDLAHFVSDDFPRFLATLAEKALAFGQPVSPGSTFTIAKQLAPADVRVDDEQTRSEWLAWWSQGEALNKTALPF